MSAQGANSNEYLNIFMSSGIDRPTSFHQILGVVLHGSQEIAKRIVRCFFRSHSQAIFPIYASSKSGILEAPDSDWSSQFIFSKLPRITFQDFCTLFKSCAAAECLLWKKSTSTDPSSRIKFSNLINSLLYSWDKSCRGERMKLFLGGWKVSKDKVGKFKGY